MKRFNIVELFSGIGSQARALKNIGIDINVQATCEWDIHALVAYDVIHNGIDIDRKVEKMSREKLLEILSKYSLSNDGKTPLNPKSLKFYNTYILKRIFSAINRSKNLINVSTLTGLQMPNKIDLLTYSFPCQDLSNVGAFHGYNKGINKDSQSRSSLLWQVGRILEEMKQCGKILPRYLVMENVPTLLSDRHRNNFLQWIDELNELGYESKYVRVNARHYGIPQNRPRLLMLSVYVGDNNDIREVVKNIFLKWGNDEEYILNKYKASKYYKSVNVAELLRISADKNSALRNEEIECVPKNTPSRKKIWSMNPKIVDENGNITSEQFIRTITTKQDRHPNSGNFYINTGIEGRAFFRFLTPRECLLFMGFEDLDYERLKIINCCNQKRGLFLSRDKIYKLAGNSIPVKMLEGFFYQFYDVEKYIRNIKKAKIKSAK